MQLGVPRFWREAKRAILFHYRSDVKRSEATRAVSRVSYRGTLSLVRGIPGALGNINS